MSLIEKLAKWFSKARRVVIVGVGNSLRRDDNIGVEIVSGLEGRVSKSFFLIKSETMPENFIGSIIEFKPTHILIIDAALLNLSPGTAKFVKSIKVSKVTISTHTLPIKIFCEYLTMMTSAKIAMLLIQPQDVSFGEGLTHELAVAGRKIVNHLINIIESVVD